MQTGTPNVLKCSVGQRHETDCGLCSRYPSMKECIPIAACKREIQVHLQHLHLSKPAVASEGDLILLRSGIFHGNREGLDSMSPSQRNSWPFLAPQTSVRASSSRIINGKTQQRCFKGSVNADKRHLENFRFSWFCNRYFVSILDSLTTL